MCGRSRLSATGIAYASELAGSNPMQLDQTESSADKEPEIPVKNIKDANYTQKEVPMSSAEKGTNTPNLKSHLKEFNPCENCMPGRAMPIVIAVNPEVDANNHLNNKSEYKRQLKRARWGLIPSYTKKDVKLDFFKMNNARVERLSVVHRNSLKKRRHCIVVVDGFYEWKTMDAPYTHTGKVKQPYYIYRKDGKPLMFAGLYDYYTSSDNERIATYTIITVPVSESLKWLHHRMPAVLKSVKDAMQWLHNDKWEVCSQLLVSENDLLTWHPVSTKMNKTSYQGEDCAKAISLKKPQNISSFFRNRTPDKSNPKTELKKHTTPDKSDPRTELKKYTTPVKSDPRTELKKHTVGKLIVQSPIDEKQTSAFRKKRKMDSTSKSPQKSITSFFTKKKQNN